MYEVVLTSKEHFWISAEAMLAVVGSRPTNQILWVDAVDYMRRPNTIRADQIVSYRKGGF